MIRPRFLRSVCRSTNSTPVPIQIPDGSPPGAGTGPFFPSLPRSILSPSIHPSPVSI
ncbi:hypothetical protein CALCODRAFT_492549 [Calocera cornea HHB12733]|uniref:Uncharacterized protein n=1 Tax=Calocera cornea HHB12733 TaxID=1353952 RepID=A0A165IF08_9BASI|nr:hypothetical protein CALCODRAFT_492549 [Calocera cornea HHB12733]